MKVVQATGADGTPSDKELDASSLPMEEKAKCDVSPDIDFYGGDIRGIYAPSSAFCCQMCKEETGCVKWTYAVSAEKGACWLKSENGQPTSKFGMVSGTLV